MAIDRNYTVGTGFLSTPFLLQTLCTYGYTDTAYRMLENTQAPGWLAMTVQGATTVWEQYIGYTPNGHPLNMSFNHYSPGSMCAFLFDTVCGIRIDGKNHFRIAPLPGGSVTEAAASYASPYGVVSSRWKRKRKEIQFTLDIPSNTTADVFLPNDEHYLVSAGTHVFTTLI